MLCRHCKRSAVCRPRGLCWSCYYAPGLRVKYPSTSKFARRGVGAYFANGTPPTASTQALPGTPEKVAVLAQRAGQGQQLWHPADATLEDTFPHLAQVG